MPTHDMGDLLAAVAERRAREDEVSGSFRSGHEARVVRGVRWRRAARHSAVGASVAGIAGAVALGSSALTGRQAVVDPGSSPTASGTARTGPQPTAHSTQSDADNTWDPEGINVWDWGDRLTTTCDAEPLVGGVVNDDVYFLSFDLDTPVDPVRDPGYAADEGEYWVEHGRVPADSLVIYLDGSDGVQLGAHATRPDGTPVNASFVRVDPIVDTMDPSRIISLTFFHDGSDWAPEGTAGACEVTWTRADGPIGLYGATP